jgi:hypothetical protein
MSQNIFDQFPTQEQSTINQLEAPKQRNGLAGFIAGTATLAFLAVVAPIYIHVLVKIAVWSWNLI